MFQPDRRFLPVSRSVSDYLVISLILLSFRFSILQENLFPHQGRAKQSEEVASSEVQSQLIKSRAPTKLENTEKDRLPGFGPSLLLTEVAPEGPLYCARRQVKPHHPPLMDLWALHTPNISPRPQTIPDSSLCEHSAPPRHSGSAT